MSLNPNSQPPTIFERIAANEVPSYTVFRSPDHEVMGILDIHPATRGHVLVFPYEPVPKIEDLPQDRYDKVMAAGRFTARLLGERLNPLRVTQAVVGYDVQHAHLHVYPSYVREDTGGLWRPGRLQEPVDHDDLELTQSELTLSTRQLYELDIALDRYDSLGELPSPA